MSGIKTRRVAAPAPAVVSKQETRAAIAAVEIAPTPSSPTFQADEQARHRLGLQLAHQTGETLDGGILTALSRLGDQLRDLDILPSGAPGHNSLKDAAARLTKDAAPYIMEVCKAAGVSGATALEVDANGTTKLRGTYAAQYAAATHLTLETADFIRERSNRLASFCATAAKHFASAEGDRPLPYNEPATGDDARQVLSALNEIARQKGNDHAQKVAKYMANKAYNARVTSTTNAFKLFANGKAQDDELRADVAKSMVDAWLASIKKQDEKDAPANARDNLITGVHRLVGYYEGVGEERTFHVHPDRAEHAAIVEQIASLLGKLPYNDFAEAPKSDATKVQATAVVASTLSTDDLLAELAKRGAPVQAAAE